MVARVSGVIPVVSGGFWFSCSDDSQVEEDGDIVFARVPFFSWVEHVVLRHLFVSGYGPVFGFLML